MKPILDETHERGTESWVESANSPSAEFPIQNLPFGVFRSPGSLSANIGVAIGDSIVSIAGLANEGLLAPCDSATIEACRAHTLNELI